VDAAHVLFFAEKPVMEKPSAEKSLLKKRIVTQEGMGLIARTFVL